MIRLNWFGARATPEATDTTAIAAAAASASAAAAARLADLHSQMAAIDKVLAVIEFDPDGTIKHVNDRFGHAGGDEVLKAVAKALGRGLRTGDLLGRFGGEEFCILLPDATLEQALAIGERLRADIECNAGSAVRHLAETRITMSFGVEQLSGDVPQFAPLSNRADQALYHSKQNGRNRVTAWGHMPVG